MKQGTDEWLAVRCGKFTASDFHIFFGNSETKKTKLLKKAAERITGEKEDDGYSNKNMERGIELEADAREEYEAYNFVVVDEVGFVELDKNIGCSPDGLVGEDGLIEIKSPLASTYLKHFDKGKKVIQPIYNTQMQFNMYVCNRKWCDYVCYHPDFKNKPLFVQRIKRDEEYILKIKNCLNECNLEIERIIKNFKGV